MSIEFDIACLRAPCSANDVIGVTQLIDRAKMAADQIEMLINQRDELLTALESAEDMYCAENCGSTHTSTCREYTELIKKIRSAL
jgi:hypothetical protein